jgi:hypothetical protein
VPGHCQAVNWSSPELLPYCYLGIEIVQRAEQWSARVLLITTGKLLISYHTDHIFPDLAFDRGGNSLVMPLLM